MLGPSQSNTPWMQRFRAPRGARNEITPGALLGMAKVRARLKSQSEESDIALLCAFGVFLAIGLCLSYLIFSLLQPTRAPNPGMAAFDPGATRLVPLPRTSDAPALAELPAAPDDAARNALAQASEPPAKPEAKPAAHRRGAARSAPRRDLAPQWNSPYRDWNDNHGWNSAWRGGPKSWF